MTIKFNQSMYAWMRAKNVRVTEKGSPITTATPSTPDNKAVRTASLDTSIKEINPQSKRQRTRDKQKEKANSLTSSV